VYYPEVIHHEVKNGVCPVCGRHRTRRMTFSQTINPYNLNQFGQAKKRGEIQEELRLKGRHWEPDFRCTHCARSQDGWSA
jgi:hypothetical protein